MASTTALAVARVELERQKDELLALDARIADGEKWLAKTRAKVSEHVELLKAQILRFEADDARAAAHAMFARAVVS